MSYAPPPPPPAQLISGTITVEREVGACPWEDIPGIDVEVEFELRGMVQLVGGPDGQWEVYGMEVFRRGKWIPAAGELDRRELERASDMLADIRSEQGVTLAKVLPFRKAAS